MPRTPDGAVPAESVDEDDDLPRRRYARLKASRSPSRGVAGVEKDRVAPKNLAEMEFSIGTGAQKHRTEMFSVPASVQSIRSKLIIGATSRASSASSAAQALAGDASDCEDDDWRQS